jgi:PleD family two-component response regulator
MLNYFLVIDNTGNEQKFELAIRRINKNFRLISAVNCKEGLRIYRKVNPQFVLINYDLADLTGLECFQQLMSVQKNRHAAVYIHHRLITQNLVSKALYRGAKACFSFNGSENDIKSYLLEIMRTSGFN